MTPLITMSVIAVYFALLFFISQMTSRSTTSQTFFTADHQSHWTLVAYGMIGVGISGITFISVPGEVGNSQFTYFQLVIGYAVGLVVIALILLPLYSPGLFCSNRRANTTEIETSPLGYSNKLRCPLSQVSGSRPPVGHKGASSRYRLFCP